MSPEVPRIVGLNGNAGSGKDTVGLGLAQSRWEYERLAFADVLKDLALRIGWSGRKDEEGRKLLEDLGEGVRVVLGADAWVKPVRETILSNPRKRYVITDMRYPNEAELVRNLGGMCIRVVRPGYSPGGPSDRKLGGYGFDAQLLNTGSVPQLQRSALKLIRGFRPAWDRE